MCKQEGVFSTIRLVAQLLLSCRHFNWRERETSVVV